MHTDSVEACTGAAGRAALATTVPNTTANRQGLHVQGFIKEKCVVPSAFATAWPFVEVPGLAGGPVTPSFEAASTHTRGASTMLLVRTEGRFESGGLVSSAEPADTPLRRRASTVRHRSLAEP